MSAGPYSARPRTAGASTQNDEHGPSRLHSRPQTAGGSHKRSRRHTDATSYRPEALPPAVPAVGPKYIELNYSTSTLSGSNHRKRFSEDVADRNLRLARPDGHLPTTGRSVDILDHNLPGYPRVVVEKSKYSEGVADRNMSMSTTSARSRASSDMANIRVWGEPLKAVQMPDPDSPSFGYGETGSRNRSSNFDRIVSPQGTTVMYVPPTETDSYYGDSDLYPISSFESTHPGSRQHSRMSSLEAPVQDYLAAKRDPTKGISAGLSSLKLKDQPVSHHSVVNVKPLNGAEANPPPIPRRATKHKLPEHLAANGTQASVVDNSPDTGIKKSATAKNDPPTDVGERTRAGHGKQAAPGYGQLADPTVAGHLVAAGINLTNTKETHIYETVAPAATKHLITPTMREIRTEVVTKEIHHHDVFHRILPIRHVELLPARHFMQNADGSVREIAASSVPAGAASRLVLERVETREDAPYTPRKFTASTLEGFPQDYAERVDPDGVTRSHTTWIHPPRLQHMGEKTGQTVPFEFGTANERTLAKGGPSNEPRSQH